MTRLNVEAATGEHFERIHRAALVLTGNPWDADDLAQETFLVLTQRAQDFEGRSSLYTWLYGILLNLERRHRRRYGIQRRKLQVLWNDRPRQPALAPPAETAIEVRQWKRSLWCLVAKLPDGQRQALVLRFSEQLRYQEIADILSCPLGTVKSRIFHGLSALRRMLDEDHEDLRCFPTHPHEDLIRAV